jgi:hypothetical protein
VTDRPDDAWRFSPGFGLPTWLRREAVSFLLAGAWVVYGQALVIVVLMGRAGRFDDLQQVLLVMGFVGVAPLVAMALRAHVERHSGPRSGGVWDVGRRQSDATPEAAAGRRARVTDVAVGVVSVAAFWAFYAGSLVAAAVVPAVVWWVVLDRLRWPESSPG